MQEAKRSIATMENGYLNLAGLHLTELPPLPEGVEQLNCSLNSLTTLPPLPSTLRHLNCQYNNLTELPPLPPNLITLSCENNNLTKLPALPSGIRKVYFTSNKIRELPDIPASLGIPMFTPRGVEIMTFSGDYNPLLEPYRRFYNNFRGSDNFNRFMNNVNRFNQYKKELKEEIIDARFDPRKIQRNMNRNQIDPEAPVTENIISKYYNRRGEVWTEGVGTKKGGKSRRRKSSKRKTRKV